MKNTIKPEMCYFLSHIKNCQMSSFMCALCEDTIREQSTCLFLLKLQTIVYLTKMITKPSYFPFPLSSLLIAILKSICTTVCRTLVTVTARV